ncbi:MAG: hypothetical protein QGG09_05045, partial [Pirellulaceae bacterium]|nr:hypothetical protein [Pirellulaceae bacterium]
MSGDGARDYRLRQAGDASDLDTSRLDLGNLCNVLNKALQLLAIAMNRLQLTLRCLATGWLLAVLQALDIVNNKVKRARHLLA